MTRIVIGVMGPGGSATPAQIETAYALGYAIASAGWVVLTGGRHVGVMDAACRGAQAAGGLTVGILPSTDGADMSSAVDIPILTGLGDARNGVNVLSSRVVVACGLGPGTAAEIALALKAQRPVILMAMPPNAIALWQSLATGPLAIADTVAAATDQIQRWLAPWPPLRPSSDRVFDRLG
ncbi:cytochrome [Leptolyngbya sp. CCNP1308]|uniref:SLOG cluster 4 domain-containing protein n=1 Tax=Leptolyngbya sp. CCNP1308 TaxID=3110255 RepID=UPI002B21916B|nr:cytochrome [Leptolyngbya sp. CCNP1308]MEA5451406.1 cytochrome [Leptolyngbya sp. CCNP1308]